MVFHHPSPRKKPTRQFEDDPKNIALAGSVINRLHDERLKSIRFISVGITFSCHESVMNSFYRMS